MTVDDRPQLDLAPVLIDGRRGHAGVAAPRPVEYRLPLAALHVHFGLRSQRGLDEHIVVLSVGAARACGYDDELAHAVGHACVPAL